MEFSSKKSSKTLNAAAARHAPYSTGKKSLVKKFHNGVCLDGSYITPPRKLVYQRSKTHRSRSASSLFKKSNSSRANDILQNSLSQNKSTNKENSTDFKWISQKVEVNSPVKSTKRLFSSIKANNDNEDPYGVFKYDDDNDDDDDEVFLSSKFEKKIKEQDKENNNNNYNSKVKTPNSSLKVYEKKRKPFNILKSSIAYDLSPEKVQSSFGSNRSSPIKLEAKPKYRFKSIVDKENTSVEDEVSQPHEEPSPVIEHPFLIGFPNYGNTCYLNAVLQTLVGLEPFIVDMSQIMRKIQVSRNSLAHSFWNVIRGRQRMDALAIRNSLRKMKENVEKIDGSFSGFKMQDANEFLTQVLDTIKDEIDHSLLTALQERNTAERCGTVTPERPPSLIRPCSMSGFNGSHKKKSARNSSLFDTPSPDSPVALNFKLTDIISEDDDEKSEIKRSNLKDSRLTPDDSVKSKASVHSRISQLSTPERDWDASEGELTSNPVKDNFEFQLLESYRCLGCGEVEGRKQKHFALYVNLPYGSDTSIQSAVETYMGEDQRELTCEKCGHKNSSVLTSFMQFPRILIVQIKRYEYKPEQLECIKVSSKVDVDMWLHLDSVASSGGQVPPHWTPKPLRLTSSKEPKPNTLSVRNLSSELNICENTSEPSNNFTTGVANHHLESPPKNGVQAKETEEEIVIHNLDNNNESQTQSSDQGNPDQEEEEFQRAIRLSLEEMGMCYSHEEEQVVEQSNSEDKIQLQHREEGAHSYKLMSVISHFGLTTCTGHYVSDIFNCKEGQWFHYDDDSVAQLQESVVLAEGRQKNGYIFFYIHRDVYHQLRSKAE